MTNVQSCSCPLPEGHSSMGGWHLRPMVVEDIRQSWKPPHGQNYPERWMEECQALFERYYSGQEVAYERCPRYVAAMRRGIAERAARGESAHR